MVLDGGPGALLYCSCNSWQVGWSPATRLSSAGFIGACAVCGIPGTAPSLMGPLCQHFGGQCLRLAVSSTVGALCGASACDLKSFALHATPTSTRVSPPIFSNSLHPASVSVLPSSHFSFHTKQNINPKSAYWKDFLLPLFFGMSPCNPLTVHFHCERTYRTN